MLPFFWLAPFPTHTFAPRQTADLGVQLTHLFDNSLKGRRDEIALECDGPGGDSGHPQRFTFGELDERANRLAHVLSARGLKTGDRLCLRLPSDT